MTEKLDNTLEWEQKTAGEQYNNNIRYYTATDLNWNMYNDNQWVGVKANDLLKFQANVCKQSTNYQRASILSRPIKAEYDADNIPEPMPGSQDPVDLANKSKREIIKKLTQAASMKWEKEKMQHKLHEILLDGAVSGDMCVHTYWDETMATGQLETGDFHTDVIDGARVMPSNPNSADMQSQEYILIVGREAVSKLKAEAKRNKVSQYFIDAIMSDRDTEYQIGERGKIELESKDDVGAKATYVIKYWKDESGEVFWNKSTRYCQIVKNRKLGNAKGEYIEETKITRYPIAWGNWDIIKNSYHGNSLIGGIVDNQLTINQLIAMCNHWMRLNAFGKTIIDSDRIEKWTNKLNEVIKCSGSTDGVVKQLAAGNFNSAILELIKLIVQYTKEFSGATEGALGQINPEQASGTAIMMAAKQSAVPHANILENLTQFVEDIYLIWGEFMLKKYNTRKLFFKNEKNMLTAFDYNSEDISDVLLSCKVNVGPSSIYSETVLMQNLDSLAQRGPEWITPVEYYEAVATMNILPNPQKLIANAKVREMQKAQIQQMQQQLALAQGLPPQLTTATGQGANSPELQGALGATAQNSLRTSQPKQS